MGVKLKWVKKSKRDVPFFSPDYFFLAHFDFYKKIISCFWAHLSGRFLLKSGAGEIENASGRFCDLPPTSVLSSLASATGCVQLNEATMELNKNGCFRNAAIIEAGFGTSIKASISSFKQTYPHRLKTLFRHLVKKSNLLVRSDNNTGFSGRKILQTTTI